MAIYSLWGEFQEWKESRQLEITRNKTYGLIISFGSSGGKTADIPAKYVFDVEGKRYEGFFNREKLCYIPAGKDAAMLMKLKIPVLYDPQNPSINRILVKKRDYKRYKVQYPDSTRASMEKYFGCRSWWGT